MAQATLSYKLSPSRAPALRALLAADDWSFADKPHMAWQAKSALGVVSCYTSGSLVIQSSNADVVVALLELDDVAPKAPKGASAASSAPAGRASSEIASKTPVDADDRLAIYHRMRDSFGAPAPDAWIGIDEAGKGDFFGPLVTAAVRVQLSDLPWLAELGVGDSKQINDSNVKQLASQLKKSLPYSIIKLMPETYNRLYGQFGNLNRLLAWAHATSSEEVLAKAPAELIFSDQFTKELIVPKFFKGAGKDCRYVQQTKAEADAAVGCASILARAEFLWGMHELSEAHGMTLRKGAGEPTIADAKRFLARYGADALTTVAKTHFKTMETIGAR